MVALLIASKSHAAVDVDSGPSVPVRNVLAPPVWLYPYHSETAAGFVELGRWAEHRLIVAYVPFSAWSSAIVAVDERANSTLISENFSVPLDGNGVITFF